jgi:hypothetical protein
MRHTNESREAVKVRIAVISTQNTLLSGAISKYLCERGDLMPQRVIRNSDDEPFLSCRSVNAAVLLMEVTRMPPFTIEARKATIAKVRAACPTCKIALLCDENADPETAEKVAELRKIGAIDNFFYSSVSGEYLAAALEAM